MANSSLYSAYKASGKAGGDYASSLQEMMGIAEEKQISRQSYLAEQDSSDRKYGALLQGLGLASTFAGGIQDQKTAKSDIKRHTGGKAVQTVGETKIWDMFTGKSEFSWKEAGERLGVLFGGKEAMWEWEGKGYKQSDLLAGAKLADVESISGKTMDDEVGGVTTKTKDLDPDEIEDNYVARPSEDDEDEEEDEEWMSGFQ